MIDFEDIDVTDDREPVLPDIPYYKSVITEFNYALMRPDEIMARVKRDFMRELDQLTDEEIMMRWSQIENIIYGD